jgi:hypothetical protein
MLEDDGGTLTFPMGSEGPGTRGWGPGKSLGSSLDEQSSSEPRTENREPRTENL